MPPETPQIRLRALFFGRRGNWNDAVLAGIERADHPTNRAALAGCIITFEHRDQRMAAHALVAHQAGQACLLNHQLLVVAVLVQRLGHVQAIDQPTFIQAGCQRRGMRMRHWARLGLQRGLQAIEQNASDRQAAVILVSPFDHIPGRIIATGAAQHTLANAYKFVVGF